MDIDEPRRLQAPLGPADGLVQLGRTAQPVADAVTEPGEVRVGAVGPEGFGAEAFRRGVGGLGRRLGA